MLAQLRKAPEKIAGVISLDVTCLKHRSRDRHSLGWVS